MSKKNPFAGAQLVLRNGSPLEDLRLGNSSQLALSSATGEINAYSQADLINSITQLMQAVASGQVVPVGQSALASSEEYARVREERREVLAAAFADSSGNKWAALGASIAAQLQEQRTREGFLRRICLGSSLKQGEVARVTMPAHDVVAVMATGSASVDYQLVRQRVFTPTEFEIVGSVRVENMDLQQVSGDLLDEAYVQGQDAIMVREDRLWKMAADQTVGVANALTYIAGNLTPQLLGSLRDNVTDWNIPATSAIISNDFWSDVTGSADFAQFLDPVSKYDLVMNGYLGTLAGLGLITDAFRQPNQKVLDRGEIYVIASPENHAAYTDRGGITSTPTSGADQGNTTRGWLFSEIMSFILANPRSVAKGKRV